jgi:hypothetical protein
MNIIKAINDKTLLGPYFEDLKTWDLWLTLLKAAFALKLTPKELKDFQKHTGRKKPPQKEVETLVISAGRRSGKSYMASIIAVYLALFRDYKKILSSGEYGIIQIIAADKSQAHVIFRYISAILNESPIFAPMIEAETKIAITLSTRVIIEVQTCSFRSLRGRTLVACIADEVAFWYSEGARADVEVIRAIQPALITVPDSKLILISSPYSQRGVLFNYFKDHWGKDRDDVLCFRATSLELNKTLNKEIIARALKDDRESASAEWLAEWRTDLATFLSADLIDELTVEGRLELAPVPGTQYVGFVDNAGGSGKDSYALAIAHQQDGKLILDCLKYIDPPFDPFEVSRDYAKLFKEYHIDTVVGDRWSGGWVEEAYKKHNIRYIVSKLSKSEIYLGAEPHFSRKQLELLDDERLGVELKNLERRTRKLGRDVVDHGLTGRDDAANAACGALYLASQVEDRVIVFDPYMESDRVIQAID